MEIHTKHLVEYKHEHWSHSKWQSKKQREIVFHCDWLCTETKLGETRIAEPTKNCWSILYVIWSFGYLNHTKLFSCMCVELQENAYSKSSGCAMTFDLVVAS